MKNRNKEETEEIYHILRKKKDNDDTYEIIVAITYAVAGWRQFNERKKRGQNKYRDLTGTVLGTIVNLGILFRYLETRAGIYKDTFIRIHSKQQTNLNSFAANLKCPAAMTLYGVAYGCYFFKFYV